MRQMVRHLHPPLLLPLLLSLVLCFYIRSPFYIRSGEMMDFYCYSSFRGEKSIQVPHTNGAPSIIAIQQGSACVAAQEMD